MHRFLSLLAVVGCMLASQLTFASQEGILLWSEFAISSQGVGSSGQVKISGTQGFVGILGFKVEVFGREFTAPSSTVQELRGFSANGLYLSYEHGYEEVGGRTVYLIFSRGFTTGVVRTKTVAVNESGEFKVIKGASK